MSANRKSWRCFFCDEVFHSRKSAYEHFGEEGCTTDLPACVDPLRRDEKMRMLELQQARDYALRLQRELEASENESYRATVMESELKRYFGKDCTSVWQAGDRYKSALNRLEDLEAKAVDAAGWEGTPESTSSGQDLLAQKGNPGEPQ